MRGPAGVAAVERSARRSILAWCLVAAETALLFALVAAATGATGLWTPDIGVLVLVALAARGDARGLWVGAFAVAAARIAVGIDPPSAVLFGYVTAAALHASVCAVVNPDGPLGRAVSAAVYATLFAAWLSVAHALRNPGVLGSPEQWISGAAATGLATGLAAFVLVPILRRLPGLRSGRAGRASTFTGPRWMRGVPAGRSA